MRDLLPLDATMKSYLSFRLDRRLYGIEVLQIREVSPVLPITPVPHAPQATRGLFNLRSRIYLALDLRPILGLPPIAPTAESRLIILKPEFGHDVGVLVESGGGIVRTNAAAIEPAGVADLPSENAGVLVTGVCMLPGELMVVIDMKSIAGIVLKLMRPDAAP